jgi:AbiTii
MTLLDDLIDGASGDAAVADLLRKVKVIASRMELGQLDDWVEHELNGYPSAVPLPTYRGPFPAEVRGDFGGPFGSGIKNGLLPTVGFPAEWRDGSLFNVVFTQSIAELEELSAADDLLREEWPANAVALTNSLAQQGKVTLYEGMGLQHAWKPISPGQIKGIVDRVRTRILDLALALEKAAPDAGQADSQPISATQAQTIVTHIYGGSSNIAIASSDVRQRLAAGPSPGDLGSLLEYMRSLGVDESHVSELPTAISRDEHEHGRGGLGPNASGWIGRLVATGGSFAMNMSAGAAGELAAAAILAYLGMG